MTFGLSASALFFPVFDNSRQLAFPSTRKFTKVFRPTDQALVSQGRIRSGMSQGAVWLAWGDPSRKRRAPCADVTETWITMNTYATVPYPYYGPYGPRYGYGFIGATRFHHSRLRFLRRPVLRPVLLFLHSTAVFRIQLRR